MKKLLDWIKQHPKVLTYIESVGWGLIGFGIGYGVGCIFSFA